MKYIAFTDGNTVPTISQLSVIHDEFGESWAVSEEDSLFSPEVSAMIHEDISKGSPYTPVYTAQFQSEELKTAAEEVSVTYFLSSVQSEDFGHNISFSYYLTSRIQSKTQERWSFQKFCIQTKAHKSKVFSKMTCFSFFRIFDNDNPL